LVVRLNWLVLFTSCVTRSREIGSNGRTIAVGCSKGTIRVYDADPWWEPGHEPKRPEPVKLDIKPTPEAKKDEAKPTLVRRKSTRKLPSSILPRV